MAKRLTIDFSADAAQTPAKFRSKMQLSDVRQVDISELHVNATNIQYFEPETQQYFERLSEDIRKRGIIVPLVAKKDGTLLAGHNRLSVAKKLGLRFIPVQYLQDELSLDAEKEFVIKDNLFRRQFSQEEWVGIYKQLVPDFENIIARDGRGKHRNNGMDLDLNVKKDIVLFNPKTATTKEMVRHLANETGEKPDTVQKRIQREKTKVKRKAKTQSPVKKDIVLSSPKLTLSLMKKEIKTLIDTCGDKKILVKVIKLLS